MNQYVKYNLLFLFLHLCDSACLHRSSRHLLRAPSDHRREAARGMCRAAMLAEERAVASGAMRPALVGADSAGHRAVVGGLAEAAPDTPTSGDPLATRSWPCRHGCRCAPGASRARTC